MLKIIFLFVGILINHEVGKVESDRLENSLMSNLLAPSDTLKAVANRQCLSIVERDYIGEMDSAGKNFHERLRSVGFNPVRTKFNEFYFKGLNPMGQAYINDIVKEVNKNRFTHYGISVRYSNGYYFTVITVGNFGIFI